MAPLASCVDLTQLGTTIERLDILRRIPSLPPTGVGPGTLSASICWNLWVSRNHLVFQKRDFTPEETLLKAICEAREWSLAHDLAPKPSQPRTRIIQDPNRDHHHPRMFTDAAWNQSTMCAGLAWIIDDAGTTTPHSATSRFVASPLIAETFSMRNAMISVLHNGLVSLTIFSDSQILIDLVNSKRRNLEILTLLNNIHLLSLKFNLICFIFIPRLDNCEADVVAKHALLSL